MTDTIDLPRERAEKTTDWLRLYVFLPNNPKYRRLPSDGARVAYVHALVAAFLERVRGVWLDRSYLEASLRDYAVYIDDLIDEDLIRVRRDGTHVIPQWRLWNPLTPTEARKQDELLASLIDERDKARERKRKRLERSGQTPDSRGQTPDITHGLDHIDSEGASESASEREREIVASRTSGADAPPFAAPEDASDPWTHPDESVPKTSAVPPAGAAPRLPTCFRCDRPDEPMNLARGTDGRIFHYGGCPPDLDDLPL